MASISIDIHPNPGETRAKYFSGTEPFSILYVSPNAAIYVDNRAILDALQAALDKIRADMDREAADWAPGELVEAWGS